MASSLPGAWRLVITAQNDYRIIENDYLHDILAQPRALEDTFHGLSVSTGFPSILDRLRKDEYQRIVLTGMGSSFHALYPLQALLTSRRYTTLLVETSELIHYHAGILDPRTLIIAVSQSGRSAEIVHLLDVNSRRAQIIAVTNSGDNPLALQADAVFLTQAGKEFSVSCKTYVTALMVLQWVGALLSNTNIEQMSSELTKAAPAVTDYLQSWRKHVFELADCFEPVRHLFLVGRGPSLAAVGTGALIIKESVHYHAEGMSSAAFRHGPLEMVSQETFVIVLAGDERTRALNVRLLDDIRGKGGRGVLLGRESKMASLRIPLVPESVLPILEILPLEMATLALAARTGTEAGRFSLASKVTITE